MSYTLPTHSPRRDRRSSPEPELRSNSPRNHSPRPNSPRSLLPTTSSPSRFPIDGLKSTSLSSLSSSSTSSFSSVSSSSSTSSLSSTPSSSSSTTTLPISSHHQGTTFHDNKKKSENDKKMKARYWRVGVLTILVVVGILYILSSLRGKHSLSSFLLLGEKKQSYYMDIPRTKLADEPKVFKPIIPKPIPRHIVAVYDEKEDQMKSEQKAREYAERMASVRKAVDDYQASVRRSEIHHRAIAEFKDFQEKGTIPESVEEREERLAVAKSLRLAEEIPSMTENCFHIRTFKGSPHLVDVQAVIHSLQAKFPELSFDVQISPAGLWSLQTLPEIIKNLPLVAENFSGNIAIWAGCETTEIKNILFFPTPQDFFEHLIQRNFLQNSNLHSHLS